MTRRSRKTRRVRRSRKTRRVRRSRKTRRVRRSRKTRRVRRSRKTRRSRRTRIKRGGAESVSSFNKKVKEVVLFTGMGNDRARVLLGEAGGDVYGAIDIYYTMYETELEFDQPDVDPPGPPRSTPPPEDLTQDTEEEADACSICLDEELPVDIKTTCGHSFHKDCIERWLHENNKCPECSKEVPLPDIVSGNESEPIRRAPTPPPMTDADLARLAREWADEEEEEEEEEEEDEYDCDKCDGEGNYTKTRTGEVVPCRFCPRRIDAANGLSYTYAEFREEYPDNYREQWENALEEDEEGLNCTDCDGTGRYTRGRRCRRCRGTGLQ